jgi:hypothetical protein
MIGGVNLVLLLILFSVSFTGSMVSISTVEMAEAEAALQDELKLIEKDTSRVKWVRIFIQAGELQIPKDCENQVVADQFIKQEKIRYFLSIVPLINKIDLLKFPDKVVLLISSTFMGLLGALIMLIKQSTYDKLKLKPELILKRAALGFSSGLLVIVLSYVLPTIITLDSDVNIKIETLTTFSLLAGMFFKNLLEKISNRVN